MPVSNRGFIAGVLYAVSFMAIVAGWVPSDVMAQAREPIVDDAAEFAATALVNGLDEQVLGLFRENKCVECHGSAVAKPKNFGYIDNLLLLRADSALVVPGDPEASELVFQVETGLMPPKKSGAAPLNESQVALVRRWIESLPQPEPPSPDVATAPVDAPPKFIVSDDHQSTAIEANASAKPLSLGDRWLRFLGQFHPASVHFPIAFLIGALLAEFWRVTSGRESMAAATRFCLWMGAITAAPTAVLGWLNASCGGYDDWAQFPTSQLDIHRWLGVATVVGAWAVLVLYELRLRSSGTRLRTYFNWALLILAVLTAATGFFGGLVSYGGLSHYAF